MRSIKNEERKIWENENVKVKLQIGRNNMEVMKEERMKERRGAKMKWEK